VNSELRDGQTLGVYTIRGRLGRGGMASVHRAYEPGLDREVALKVLPAEVVADPELAHRFEHEAKLIARLEHPNIVPVYAYGIDGGRPWMALRLVRGKTLAERLAEGLDRSEALRILAAVASALDYAHAHKIIHRDLKPANVLVSNRSEIYLADFGIAKLLEGDARLTGTGMSPGTPSYMAPEQASGTDVTAAADIYALGVIAYQWLTGMLPFTADTPLAVAFKQVHAPLPLEPMKKLPERAQRVLIRALAKDPQARWTSAAEMVDALGAGLGEQLPRTRFLPPVVQSWPKIGLVAGGAALALLIGWFIAGGGRHIGFVEQLDVKTTSTVAHEPLGIDPKRSGSDTRATSNGGDADINVAALKIGEAPASSAIDGTSGEPGAAARDNAVAHESFREPTVATAPPAEPRTSPGTTIDQRAPPDEVARAPLAFAPPVPAKGFVIENGSVIDQLSGRLWQAKDNGRDIAYGDALVLCGSLGDGWRLPDANEIMSLAEGDGMGDAQCGQRRCRAPGVFRLSGSWFWTSEPGRAGTQIAVGLERVQIDEGRREDRFGMRALCVR
jgi:serine/threonine protein kinase